MITTHEGIEIEVYENSGFWWYIESEDKNSITAFPTPELALANAISYLNGMLQSLEDSWTDHLHN